LREFAQKFAQNLAHFFLALCLKFSGEIFLKFALNFRNFMQKWARKFGEI